MKSGILLSSLPDSAEPVLSEVEGLHPGYTSEGLRAAVAMVARCFSAGRKRLECHHVVWVDLAR